MTHGRSCSSDRKSTRLNSSHRCISYAVFCLNAPDAPVLSTLSLHDALPIFSCVVTSEDMTQIYGFGYNGTARGFSHDDCKFDQPGNCQCVHAEQNALIKVRVNDPRKVVFVTGQPCVTCAKLIINSGASKVYYRSAYRSDEGLELFKKAGVEIERV